MEIDRALVELMAKRMDIAKAIGKIKHSLGYPVRNFQVEKQVFSRVSQISKEVGLSEELANNVFEYLVAESVAVQSNLPHNYVQSGSSKEVLIIGGMGRMGKWLTRFFSSSGHHVRSVDPLHPPTPTNFTSLPKDLDEFDVIAISTPLNTIHETVHEVLEKRPRGLVFDIASLKTEIINRLENNNVLDGMNFVSVHPMFGPSTVNLHEKNLIVCRVRSTKAVDQFKKLFAETSVNLVEIPIEEHDKLMGYSLNLVHLINILMADMLAVNDFTFSELKQFASTTFVKQIQTTYEVAHENPDLYWSIQHFNSYRENLFEELRKSIEKIHESVRHDEPIEFQQIMRMARDYFKT